MKILLNVFLLLIIGYCSFAQLTYNNETDLWSLETSSANGIFIKDFSFDSGVIVYANRKANNKDVDSISSTINLMSNRYIIDKTDQQINHIFPFYFYDIRTGLATIVNKHSTINKFDRNKYFDDRVSIDFHFSDQANLYLENLDANEMQLDRVKINAFLQYTNINNLIVKKMPIDLICFEKSYCKQLLFDTDTVYDGELIGLKCTTVQFENCFFKNQISFINCNMPDTILFSNCTFWQDAQKVNLESLIKSDSSKKRCIIIIENTNADNIRFNYLDFKLALDSKMFNNDKKNEVYIKIREKFKKEGLFESYKPLDIEYQEFSYLKDSTLFGKVANWVDKNWWDYGYKKSRIVTNSLGLFGIFTLFNIFFFKLIFSVYQPENFKKLDDKLIEKYKKGKRFDLAYRFHKIPAIIVYTGYIFWSIKIELNNIKFDNSWWIIPFLIFIIEYLCGVICLAYIANIIIAK